MNCETGEGLPDHETGELPAVPRLDCETGEMIMNCNRPSQLLRKPFKIPKTIKKKSTAPHIVPVKHKHIPKTSNSNISPALLLLIPAFFFPAVGIFLSIFETLIHMWAHKKNKKLRHTNRYYQSPFHIVTCEFCKFCIDESASNKITKIQDKRHTRFSKYGIEYVRRVVT